VHFYADLQRCTVRDWTGLQWYITLTLHAAAFACTLLADPFNGRALRWFISRTRRWCARRRHCRRHLVYCRSSFLVGWFCSRFTTGCCVGCTGLLVQRLPATTPFTIHLVPWYSSHLAQLRDLATTLVVGYRSTKLTLNACLATYTHTNTRRRRHAFTAHTALRVAHIYRTVGIAFTFARRTARTLRTPLPCHHLATLHTFLPFILCGSELLFMFYFLRTSGFTGLVPSRCCASGPIRTRRTYVPLPAWRFSLFGLLVFYAVIPFPAPATGHYCCPTVLYYAFTPAHHGCSSRWTPGFDAVDAPRLVAPRYACCGSARVLLTTTLLPTWCLFG